MRITPWKRWATRNTFNAVIIFLLSENEASALFGCSCFSFDHQRLRNCLVSWVGFSSPISTPWHSINFLYLSHFQWIEKKT